MSRLFITVYLFHICVLFSFGQIDISADRTQIKIGEPIQITIKSKAKEKVDFPIFIDTIGAFEILEQMPVYTTKEYLKKELYVSVFDSGQYVFGPIPIQVNGDTIYTKEIPIRVFAVAVNTDKQKIYDIKEIEKVGYSRREILFMIAIVLIIFILIGLIYFIWWNYKKKKNKEVRTMVNNVLPPGIQALEMLKKMDTKKYLSNGKIKEYYTELSDIFRYYLEGQYTIEAMESITSEIIESLRPLNNFEKNEILDIENFLKQSDLVKFAKWSPLPNEAEIHRKEVERIIIKTSAPKETEEQDND